MSKIRKMESTIFGSFSLLTIWCFLGQASAQYQDLHCEALGSRQARQMTQPGPECDLSERDWCTQKTKNYPEDKIMELILDNRGVMKRLFGDTREVRMIQNEMESSFLRPENFPPPPRKRRKNRKRGKDEVDEHRTSESTKIVFESPIQNKVPTSHRNATTTDVPTTLMDPSTVEPLPTTSTTTTQAFKKPNAIQHKKPSRNKVKFPGTAERPEMPTTSPPIDSGDDLRYSRDQIPSPQVVTLETQTTRNQPPSATYTKPPRNEVHKTIQPNQYLKGRVQPPANVAVEQGFPHSSDSAAQPSIHSNVYRNKQRLPQRPVYKPNQDTHGQRYHRPHSNVQNLRKEPIQDAQRKPQKPPSSYQPENEAPYMVEKFAACNSTTELIAPTWARNMQGKNLIVVNVGSFMQHLQIEECDKNAINRKMYCQRGCRCEQQYRHQKLLVMDPDDECRGIFSDWFRFPSCCVCVCYPHVWQRKSVRNGRIYNDEYYDELFYDDEDDFIDYDEGEDYDADPDDFIALPSEKNVNVYPASSSVDRMFVVNERPNKNEWPKVSNDLLTDLDEKVKAKDKSNFVTGDKPLTIASREKKSRLLTAFNRTVNVRPQVAPRRHPPPRASTSTYHFPLPRLTNQPLWPPIPYVSRFPPLSSYNHAPRSPSPYVHLSASNYLMRSVTPSPQIRSATFGTLDRATSPFYHLKWRPDSGRSLDGSTKEKEEVLKRIPRSRTNG